MIDRGSNSFRAAILRNRAQYRVVITDRHESVALDSKVSRLPVISPSKITPEDYTEFH